MLTRNAVARSVWPLLLVLTTACSSPGGMGPERVASPAVGSPAREGAAAASPEAGTKRRSRGEEAAPVEAGAGRERRRGGASPGSLAPPDAPGPRPAVASAFRTDPSGDVERDGDQPAHVDIRRATLRGTRRLLRLTLRVDGEIPRSLPEGTDMTMNFRIEGGDDDHQLYALGARDGWKADLDNSGSFPGRFVIAGDRFVFELAWARLGGPARLRWEAETAWTRTPSGPLGQTEFAFDRVPEYEAASYPE